jgi:hypothetical protein
VGITIWSEMTLKFKDAISKAIDLMKERDVENIPGARDRLLSKFEQLMNYLPRNDGELLAKVIDESIQKSFFPKTKDIAQAFNNILNARTPDQDYIIQELINGFISSQGKAITSNEDASILDHLVEAFKKRRDFKIVDYQFYATFGDPNKPRKFVKERLNKLAEFLGLEKEEMIVEKDIRDSEEKIYTFYTFQSEIIEILNGKYLETLENGEKLITDKFDKIVFISYVLAKLSVTRATLDNYTINGISAIFALILIVSFMPKIQIDEKNPINRDVHFDAQTMSVIPKSWMTKEVLSTLLPPLIEIIAYRLGGNAWLDKIALTEQRIKMHLQAQFLLKDVNKWVLGNMCRVEIPIFVEISAILNEVLVGAERGEK